MVICRVCDDASLSHAASSTICGAGATLVLRLSRGVAAARGVDDDVEKRTVQGTFKKKSARGEVGRALLLPARPWSSCSAAAGDSEDDKDDVLLACPSSSSDGSTCRW